MPERMPHTDEIRVVAVVGASSGIGRDISMRRGTQGDALVLVARREGLLRELAREIEKAPSSAERSIEAPLVIAADIGEVNAGQDLVDQALAHFGRLDAVIYAAGWNVPNRALGDATASDWATILDVNLSGAFRLTTAAIRPMRQQGAGLLVYISSSGAKRPDRSGAAYQASKAGLAALAHAVMEECRDDGIRTTVIYPGLTDTPFLEHRPVPTDNETRRRALRPEDIASACDFVMSLPTRAYVPELLIYPSRS